MASLDAPNISSTVSETSTTSIVSSTSSSSFSSSSSRIGPPTDLIAQSVASNIQSALAAVSDIKRSELSELRISKTQPVGVFEIISAVICLVNHSKNLSDWNESKKMVTDVKYADFLKKYDPTTITDADRECCKDALALSTPKLTIVAKFHIWMKGMIAASLREATTEIDPSKALGLKLTRSGVVHYVSVRGQFYEAGIVKGDKLLGLGSIRISSSKEFAAALNLYKAAGGMVTVTFTESKKKGAVQDVKPKLKVNANEPAASAPREFGSFRAKGLKI